MSKSKKSHNRYYDEYEDDGYADRRKSIKRDMERRQSKRMKSALKTRNIDVLMSQEDY